MITKKYVSSVGDQGSKGMFNYVIKKLRQLEIIISNLPVFSPQNLLQVTTTGNITDKDVIVKSTLSKEIKAALDVPTPNEICAALMNSGALRLGSANFDAFLTSTSLTATRNLLLPNEDGILATRNYVNLQQSYSETEITTGHTWIDGSPIYRKVIPFTIVGPTLTIDVSSLNRKILLNKNVYILSVDGNYISDSVASNGNNDNLVVINCVEATDVQEVYVNSYVLEVSTGNTTPYTANRPGYLALEYTKI